jgi:hypothetical protein
MQGQVEAIMGMANLLEDYLIDLPVVLFPRCYITDKKLKKIHHIVEQLTICQPWFMDVPLPVLEGYGASVIDILLPPESLKPKGDFNGLFSEYLLWIRQHQDRGYTSFLSATQKMILSEDKPWEIRQMMGQTGEAAPVSKENNALRWHLILHLAQAFEENLTEADEMLKHMKQVKSPIEDAMGERTALPGMFEDLPQSETNLFVDDRHLRQILEAWLGLFGEILPERGLLMTLDQHVMDYVSGVFEDKGVALSKEAVESILPKFTSSQSDFTLIQFPNLADNPNAHADPVLTGLSDKIVFFLEN